MERIVGRNLITDESIVVVDIDDVLNKLGAELYLVMDNALGVTGKVDEYDFTIRYPNHSVNSLWFEILPKRFWMEVENFLPNTKDQLARIASQFHPAKVVVCTARGKLSTEQGLDRLIEDFLSITGESNYTLAVCNYFDNKLDCIAEEFPNNRVLAVIEDSPLTLKHAQYLGIPNIIKSPRPYNTHIKTESIWCQRDGILMGGRNGRL